MLAILVLLCLIEQVFILLSIAVSKFTFQFIEKLNST